MGYFSNGSEGESYEARWCSRCIHEEGCAVMMSHLVYNYDQIIDGNRDNPLGEVLSLLIPDEGSSCGECSMFVLDEDSLSAEEKNDD